MKQSFTLFFVSLFYLSLIAQEPYISYRLEQAVEESPEAVHHIGMMLKDRVDIYAMDQEFYRTGATAQERSEKVIAALKKKAVETQPELIDYLESHPDVVPGSVNGYWINNMIFARVKSEVIQELSENDQIEKIDLNGMLEMVEYVEESCELPPLTPNGAERGLKAINAHEMWKLGYTGRGRIALGADTGIDPTHPAIRGQYRGIYVDDGMAWFDEGTNGSDYPNDCDNHGTHTIGTVLGIDRLTNDTIGVAPNATWIGAQIISCPGDSGTEDNIASFQWAINPDGDSSTVSDIPDAINNSWRDPQVDNECESIYVDVLKAMEAVGIAVIFSAGNSGPDPETLTPPHNINYDLVNVFTVGALNGNVSSQMIANFSSRGPATCVPSTNDSSLVIKPEVSAPGVQVRSSVRGGEYANFNGTSMASPHVAGAILLLKEAFPYLTGRDLKFALYYSCNDLGDPGEDNTYGMGIIDVKAAYDYLVAEGNVPVDPALANDALLIHVDGPPSYCANLAYPELLVENLGSDTMTSLDIVMDFPEIPLQKVYTWTGAMMPGERQTIVPEEFQVPSGTWAMNIEIQNPNGMPDQNGFNNRFSTEVVVTDRATLEAYSTDHPDGVVCKGTRALLRNNFQLNTPGNITYEWYDQSAGGRLIGTGQALLTDPLTENTTYYADILVEYDEVGASDLSIGTIQVPPLITGGIEFDASFPFLLKSVKVFPGRRGFVNISLLDRENNELESRDFFLNTDTFQVVVLNFEVPQGQGMKLELGIGENENVEYVPLAFNRTGGSFPYEVKDVVTLKGSTVGAPGSGQYWNFYDWKIEHREVCGRTPVSVEVVPDSLAPVAAFIKSDPTVDVNNNPSVQFSDVSTGATEWFWDFGDGNTGIEQNPLHTFSATGEYIVSLTVFNADGCTASAIDTVRVIDTSVGTDELTEIEGVLVFPNPTSGALNIELDFQKIENVNFRITDLLGTPLRNMRSDNIFQGTVNMDISDLASGIYLLIIKTDDGRAIKKILKL